MWTHPTASVSLENTGDYAVAKSIPKFRLLKCNKKQSEHDFELKETFGKNSPMFENLCLYHSPLKAVGNKSHQCPFCFL